MKKLERDALGRVTFLVRLAPRSSRNEVVGWTDDGRLKVRVTSAPVDEGANRALVHVLAKLLRVKKGDVTVEAGAHSRTKRLAVPADCENRLSSFEDI